MPDLREVFQMSTQKVRPDRGFAERQEFRQRRRVQNRKIGAYAMVAAIVAIAVVAIAVVRNGPTPSVPVDHPTPTEGLGIFAPVAGRIVYPNSGLWAVDPSAPSPVSTVVRLRLERDLPLGWSSDGTELLFMRKDPTDQPFVYAYHLYILHADGSETQVTTKPVGRSLSPVVVGGGDSATIAPDGSRVVYSSDGLYVVDAEGGQPVRIAEEGESPTFSPDGTQIAYLSGPGEHVWVANADGTDAHEILADEPGVAKGVDGLQWSPAGDRIAMDNTLEGHVAIYTFAPDGSDFTKVITGGMNPYWSPDGSQIAYMLPHGLAIADADGSNVREFGFGASGPWHPGE